MAISIGQSEYFANHESIDKLNNIVQSSPLLTTAAVMNATGCNHGDALYILVLLFELNLADGYLVVWHNSERVERRSLSDGFPIGPHKDELKYTFEFEITNNNVEFQYDD